MLQVRGGFGGEKDIGTKAVWIVSEKKGVTIMDAYRKLQEKLPREIFPFPQPDYYNWRKKWPGPVFHRYSIFFTRYREARMRSYVLFTKRGGFKEFKVYS
ncbi:hypothetical protein GCM10020331_084950 [Ectobacillus funiculus]